jgi:hypothetical protein
MEEPYFFLINPQILNLTFKTYQDIFLKQPYVTKRNFKVH